MSPEHVDLLRKSGETLKAFLETELDLGFTFAALARSRRERGSLESYDGSKRNAIAALETVDRFKGRLPDDIKREIEKRRSQLEKVISVL